MPAPWLFYRCAVSSNKKTPERAQRVRNSHKRSLIGLGWGCLCWALCLPKTMQLPNLAQGPLGKHQSKQKCCHSLHLSLLFIVLSFGSLNILKESKWGRSYLHFDLCHSIISIKSAIVHFSPSYKKQCSFKSAHRARIRRLGHSIKAAIVLFPLTPLP